MKAYKVKYCMERFEGVGYSIKQCYDPLDFRLFCIDNYEGYKLSHNFDTYKWLRQLNESF